MATIIISPNEFDSTSAVIISGIVDSENCTKIDVNGTEIDLTDGSFSLDLGVLSANTYSLPVTLVDGDDAGTELTIDFTVNDPVPVPEPEPEDEDEDEDDADVDDADADEDASKVKTDNGKYTGVTENEEALKDQEFYDKVKAEFNDQKFIPDYIPNKKIIIDTDEIQSTLGGASLYNPIESLEQRFPERRNLEDIHGEFWGDVHGTHPDSISKEETDLKGPDRFTSGCLGTGGFSF